MFDIGWTEILVIAVVAIIVVGPKDLPRMLRSLGRYAGQLKRTAGEFRSQFDEAIRESELDELRTSLKDATDMNPINQIKDSVTDSLKPLEDTANDIKGGIEKPVETKKDAAKDSASDDKPDKKADTEAKSDAEAKADTEAAATKSGGAAS